MSGPQPWVTLREDVIADYEIFRVRRRRAVSPRTGVEHNFHLVDVPRWVIVIPSLPDGQLLMVEQYRHAAEAVSLEFPAGIMEPDEDPITAARRELREETGYTADRFELLRVIRPDPAINTNTLAVVLAHDCVEAGAPEQDEAEDVHVLQMHASEVDRAIIDGRIFHAMVIAAWWLRERA